MKTRIYYNGSCLGEISNSYNALDENSLPRINSILLKGNVSLDELDLMSRGQITQLISQIQNVRYSKTIPANPVINTLYYVGTTAPYNVYLYIRDDTTQEITRLDMGTTKQDLSQYQEKVDNNLETTSKNIVGAINENKANIDLKQNSTDDRLTTTAKTIYGAINEIDGNKVTSISSSSTDIKYPSAKAVYDYSAPLDGSVWAFGDVMNTNANSCLLPLPLRGRTLTNNDRVAVKGMFLGGITDPVAGGGLYGIVEVIEQAHLSSGANIFIEQVFTNKRLSNYLPVMKFRRQGYVYQQAGADLNDPSTWTVTWQPWIPIEYPQQSLAKDDSATAITGWEAKYTISGGNMIISVRNLKSDTNISRTVGYTVVSAIPLPIKISFDTGIFASLYDLDSSNSASMQVYNINGYCMQLFGLTANNRYFGQLVIPLGY